MSEMNEDDLAGFSLFESGEIGFTEPLKFSLPPEPPTPTDYRLIKNKKQLFAYVASEYVKAQPKTVDVEVVE